MTINQAKALRKGQTVSFLGPYGSIVDVGTVKFVGVGGISIRWDTYGPAYHRFPYVQHIHILANPIN